MPYPYLVQLQNVSKRINNKELVSDISFNINHGETTTLIGPNGAGKTTVAKLILGLESPTTGKVFINPNLKMGYVPQKIHFNPNLPMTAAKFLFFLVPKHHIEDEPQLLAFCDFDNIKDQNINTLSGGQLQKLMLSAALLSKPELLILDEPTKSMDVSGQQEFYKLLEKIKQRDGVTVFMISHDLFTVIKSSDQVICLNGHICCSGRPNNSQQELEELTRAMNNIGFYQHHHDHKH